MFAFVQIALAAACLSGVGNEPEGGRWTVAESNDFRFLSVANDNLRPSEATVDCRWSVLRDGTPFAAGTFDLKGLPPGASHVYAAPAALARARALGGSVSVRLRFLEGKREIVRRQIDLPDPVPSVYSPVGSGTVETNDANGRLTFSARKLVYAFSKRTGLLESIRRRGVFSDDVLMAEPMGAATFAGETFSLRAERVGETVMRPDGARFKALVRATSKGGTVVWLEVEWTIFRDGELACRCRLHPDVGKRLPPQTGIVLPLAIDEPEIAYFAPDPLLGRQAAERKALAARTKPIGCVRALEVGVGSGMTGVAAVGRPLTFAVGAAAGKTPLHLMPEDGGDLRRPQSVDFIIGPRRFANVVEVN